MLLRFSFLIIIFLSSLSAFSQIVNVESKRIEKDTAGWSGSLNLSANYTKNVNELLNLQGGFIVEYQKGASTWLLLSTGDGAYANGEVLENRLLGHLRYGFEQNNWLTYEALFQWQRDVPLHIEQRILTGAGLRFTYLDKENNSLHSGITLLYEEDHEREIDVVHQDVRLSNYLAYNIKLENGFKWNTVAYYQPRIEKWKDFRASLQTQLSFIIFKKLRFATTVALNYDAEPSFSINPLPNLTVGWNNGLTYSF